MRTWIFFVVIVLESGDCFYWLWVGIGKGIANRIEKINRIFILGTYGISLVGLYSWCAVVVQGVAPLPCPSSLLVSVSARLRVRLPLL